MDTTRTSETLSPVLVTGATGYVGEHLCRFLVRSGQRVVALVRDRRLSVPGVSVVRLHLQHDDAVRRLVDQLRPAVIFHCAAQTDVRFCQKHPEPARVDIVHATRSLMNAVVHGAPDAVVVALSTDLVFDGEHAPYREGDPTGPLSVYGQLKLEAEGFVLRHPRGLVLRTSLVYGPRATHRGSFLAWMIDALSQGQTLELFEDEVRTPIEVHDLARAMFTVAVSGRTGLWHAGGPERLDRLAMGRAVCAKLGISTAMLAPCRLSESNYAAPRPRDVSLDSRRLWSCLDDKPVAFAEGLAWIDRSHEGS